MTRLVPNLKPVEDCIDVPKEICSNQKLPPRTVKKPVTKTWCYTPEPETPQAPEEPQYYNTEPHVPEEPQYYNTEPQTPQYYKK